MRTRLQNTEWNLPNDFAVLPYEIGVVLIQTLANDIEELTQHRNRHWSRHSDATEDVVGKHISASNTTECVWKLSQRVNTHMA